MSGVISISEARATLPDVIARVVSGEEITLTRHGVPVAVIVRPDALRARRASPAVAGADALRSTLDQARSERLPTRPLIAPERADELLAELRRHRANSARRR